MGNFWLAKMKCIVMAAAWTFAAAAGTAALSVAAKADPVKATPPAIDRTQASAYAKNQFFHLNFFAEGRGMVMVPGLIEVMKNFARTPVEQKQSDEMMAHKWGLTMLNHWPAGLFDVPYKGMHVGALGCVVCHSSRAAGQYIIGLGNKNIDVLELGRGARFVETLYKEINPIQREDDDAKAVRAGALAFADLLSNPKIGNLTQGLVPVSFIRAWFYRQAGLELPDTLTRGAVKVPFLWGYGEKRKVGQFSDGFGDGNLPGWAIAVELTGGQIPETVRSYEPKIQAAEDLFSAFLPPKYPFAVDDASASAGQKVFENTCSHCHGSYTKDDQGWPIYEAPHFVDIKIVGTDSDRLENNTPEFLQLVDQNPLSDLIKHTNLGRGYFSPRLNGIWSRFPYLHNASVPNIASLLTPPSDRPKVFSVEDAGEAYRFDPINLGLTLNVPTPAGKRSTYDTRLVGQSNQGHPFGINLTARDKKNLIEYLKTL